MSLTATIKDANIRSPETGVRYIEVIATETAPGTTKATSAEIPLGTRFSSVEPVGAPVVIPTTDTNLVTCQVTKVATPGSTYTTQSVIKLTYLSGVAESITMRALLRVEE